MINGFDFDWPWNERFYPSTKNFVGISNRVLNRSLCLTCFVALTVKKCKRLLTHCVCNSFARWRLMVTLFLQLQPYCAKRELARNDRDESLMQYLKVLHSIRVNDTCKTFFLFRPNQFDVFFACYSSRNFHFSISTWDFFPLPVFKVSITRVC